MRRLIFLFALFSTCVWGDDIHISLTPNPNTAQINNVRRIVIDPGYGGKDFGSISRDKKLREKDINLIISKKVVDLLKRETNLEVLMTRLGDDDISDKQRVYFANSRKADLFVSIHCNQSDSGIEKGVRYYCYVSSPRKRKPVSTVNHKNGVTTVIFPLRHGLYEGRSRFLAETTEEQINNELKQNCHNIQQGPFYVLKKVEMPSMWIGIAYITNKEDLNNLGNPGWQDQMAKAIETGILVYRKKVNESPVGVSGPETRPRYFYK